MLKYEGRIKRYLTSHGFWKSIQSDTASKQKKIKSIKPESKTDQKERRATRTVGERVQNCCQEAVILKLVPFMEQDGSESTQRIFYANCRGKYSEIRESLDSQMSSRPVKLPVDRNTAFKLSGLLTRGGSP